ncbi:MAG: hypothetical protein KAW12_05550 [Candidatus Aminicenantes bacterium]|nr:hypothetical protein [Candidatus Aminicenantes bacterium]
MAIIGFIILIYLVYLLIVHVILPGLAIIIGAFTAAGMLTGGGCAIYNYCRALGRNVKRERA